MKRAHALKAEVDQLSSRVADRERKELERLGASKPFEQPSATISRLETEHANLEDQAAGLTPEDDQLEPETHTLEGKRPWPFAESAAKAQRLRRSAETGHGLERAILESSAFALLLAGEATDPYREDLLDRCAPHVPCAKSTAAP